jgi:hypothetical protein
MLYGHSLHSRPPRTGGADFTVHLRIPTLPITVRRFQLLTVVPKVGSRALTLLAPYLTPGAEGTIELGTLALTRVKVMAGSRSRAHKVDVHLNTTYLATTIELNR